MYAVFMGCPLFIYYCLIPYLFIVLRNAAEFWFKHNYTSLSMYAIFINHS